MPDDCPFCQIVEGELPSYDIFETEDALAFLDVNPVSKGHTLVIPKEHAESLVELDAVQTSAVFNVARLVAESIEEQLDAGGINLLQSNGEVAGQEIPHMHVHVIPRREDDGFNFSLDSESLSEEVAEDVVERVRKGLEDS